MQIDVLALEGVFDLGLSAVLDAFQMEESGDGCYNDGRKVDFHRIPFGAVQNLVMPHDSETARSPLDKRSRRFRKLATFDMNPGHMERLGGRWIVDRSC